MEIAEDLMQLNSLWYKRVGFPARVTLRSDIYKLTDEI